MRDIKFRAKRVDNNEWCYGSLIIPTAFLKGFFIHSETTFASIEGGIKIGGLIEVIPNTIGQLTDLKTFDGLELYEDDIVDNSIIVMDYPDRKTIDIDNYDIKYCDSHSKLHGWDLSKLTLLGNLNDNPELNPELIPYL